MTPSNVNKNKVFCTNLPGTTYPCVAYKLIPPSTFIVSPVVYAADGLSK